MKKIKNLNKSQLKKIEGGAWILAVIAILSILAGITAGNQKNLDVKR